MNVRLGGGGVILGKDGKIVVVEQKSNTWSLPKGGVEEGEILLEAAIREIREETGISDLEYIQELGTYERRSIAKDGVSENLDMPIGRRTFFLFRTIEETLNPTDAEITKALWVTFDEALSLISHPKDREFLASVRDQVEKAITY